MFDALMNSPQVVSPSPYSPPRPHFAHTLLPSFQRKPQQILQIS